MKAVFIKEFCGPAGLEIREVPESGPPTGDQISIQIAAAGLNRADLLQAKGLYPPPTGYSPNIPGLEFAGTIIEKGENVSELAIGDRVFGIASGEAQAERIVIEASQVAKIPDGLSYNEAAAIPEAFITAGDAIFSQAGLTSGETLLIHAVGSGVGLAALQLAKANGNPVMGTSRTVDKLERCKEFGLDHAISTESGPAFAEAVLRATDEKGVDVILDLVGGAYFSENLKALETKGRLMLVGLTGGASSEIDLGTALRKRLKIMGTVLRSRRLDEKADAVKTFAERVVPLINENKVRPNVDRVFGFTDVQEAYRYLGSNVSFGKVVLAWDQV
jgi:putative PIG3 family NAD(P)H quinone oxidoreductase